MSDGEGKGKKIAKSIYFIIYPQDQDNGRRTFLSVYYYNVLSSNTHGHLRIHIHYYKSRGNIITLMYTYYAYIYILSLHNIQSGWSDYNTRRVKYKFVSRCSKTRHCCLHIIKIIII